MWVCLSLVLGWAHQTADPWSACAHADSLADKLFGLAPPAGATLLPATDVLVPVASLAAADGSPESPEGADAEAPPATSNDLLAPGPLFASLAWGPTSAGQALLASLTDQQAKRALMALRTALMDAVAREKLSARRPKYMGAVTVDQLRALTEPFLRGDARSFAAAQRHLPLLQVALGATAALSNRHVCSGPCVANDREPALTVPPTNVAAPPGPSAASTASGTNARRRKRWLNTHVFLQIHARALTVPVAPF